MAAARAKAKAMMAERGFVPKFFASKGKHEEMTTLPGR
jgi:hypothetical protein